MVDSRHFLSSSLDNIIPKELLQLPILETIYDSNLRLKNLTDMSIACSKDSRVAIYDHQASIRSSRLSGTLENYLLGAQTLLSKYFRSGHCEDNGSTWREFNQLSVLSSNWVKPADFYWLWIPVWKETIFLRKTIKLIILQDKNVKLAVN